MTLLYGGPFGDQTEPATSFAEGLGLITNFSMQMTAFRPPAAVRQ